MRHSVIFRLHAMHDLSRYTVFDVGKNSSYFEDYMHDLEGPMNRLVSFLKHNKDFSCAVTVTGNAFDYVCEAKPDLKRGLNALAAMKNVEFIAAPYYYCIPTARDFCKQVRMSLKRLHQLNCRSEMLYLPAYVKGIEKEIEELGFRSILVESKCHNENEIFSLRGSKLRVLFASTKKPREDSRVVNRVVDFRDIDDSILEYYCRLQTVKPTCLVSSLQCKSETDLVPMQLNKLQESAIESLFSVEESVRLTNDSLLLEDWRKMHCFSYLDMLRIDMGQDSSHPMDSPYEAYIAYMNIINDIKWRAK